MAKHTHRGNEDSLCGFLNFQRFGGMGFSSFNSQWREMEGLT